MTTIFSSDPEDRVRVHVKFAHVPRPDGDNVARTDLTYSAMRRDTIPRDEFGAINPVAVVTIGLYRGTLTPTRKRLFGEAVRANGAGLSPYPMSPESVAALFSERYDGLTEAAAGDLVNPNKGCLIRAVGRDQPALRISGRFSRSESRSIIPSGPLIVERYTGWYGHVHLVTADSNVAEPVIVRLD